MRLRLIVGLALILHVSQINGVDLACHVPLEVKIFADSSYQALSADLKSCSQIILSSVNALFLPSSNTSLASILISEKRSLELLKQQTPEAEFSFSLRSTQTSPATWNLKTIFNRMTSVAQLVEFLRLNKLKSFDIAWDLIQSAPDYGPQLKSLKDTLGKEGFNLTTTIGVEVDRVDAFHVTKIASIVDRIFLVSSYNRHYSGNQYPLTETKVQQAFDALEVNEGAFLILYSTLNLSWKKIVVGLSLQTLVWTLSSGTITGTQFSQYRAILQLQSYYESCKTVNSTWPLSQQPSPFYQLAVAPTDDQWMIHIDPLTLGKRVDLLRQYGFGGVALYDYYQDDFAGICCSKGKIYPLIQQAGQSIRSSNLAVPFPDVDVDNGLCIPFLGLTNECEGAFNFGTPKISINSVAFNYTSTSSSIVATKTTLPVVNDATTTRVPSQHTVQSVTIPSSPTTEATDLLGASWALVSDDDHLIRTRRSSFSSGELGTEPSYSYLQAPGFDLFDITPRISSLNSRLELPALKSLTPATISPTVVTKGVTNVKVELSRDNQAHLFGIVSTTLSPTLHSPETGGNRAAFKESTLSSADMVASRSLPLKSEIPTSVESGSASAPTSLQELDAVTETEQIVTHLQNAMESDALVASLILSTSEIDWTTDFPTVAAVPSSQEGIDSSLRIGMKTPINFDLQDEATTNVIMYASDTREEITDFVDRISTENAMFDVTVSPDEYFTLTTAGQLSSVLANNENMVAAAQVESDLRDSSTTRPLASNEQEPIASSQFSGSVSALPEQSTSDVSSLSPLELSTVYYAASDTTGTKYEASWFQDVALTSIQVVRDDETAVVPSEMTSPEPEWSTTKQTFNQTFNQPVESFPSELPSTFPSSLYSMQASSSDISIESPVTNLSPQALSSLTAAETFTKRSLASDVFSAISIPSFDLEDAHSTSAASTEETQSTSSMDFSTPYDSSWLQVSAGVHSESNSPSEHSFSAVPSSVTESNTAEETFSGVVHILLSTVFDASPVEDYHSEYQAVIGTRYPGTSTLYSQPATKEWVPIVEEGSAESSLSSTVFFPTFEPIWPPSLIDLVSPSLIPDLAEMSTGHTGNSPVRLVAPTEETPISAQIHSSTAETSTLSDATIADIALADGDSTASENSLLVSKPELESTLASSTTDSNKIQFTESSEEDSAGESAVPFSTTSTGDEMTDIPTGYEVKSAVSSLQTSSNEEILTDDFSPTISQTSTESSLPTSEVDEVSSTLESILPFTVTDTSATLLDVIIIESSTERQHFESSLTNMKMDHEGIHSPYDLSPPYSSTILYIFGTDTDPSSSGTSLSLEIADSEVTSPVPDWNSPEVFTQSVSLSSASIDVGMTDVPAGSNNEMSVVYTSERPSVPLETSTGIHFSPSVSDEFQPSNLEVGSMASMEDIHPTNVIDIATSNSAILPDITAASTNLVGEENEPFSSTTSSLHLVTLDGTDVESIRSHLPLAVDEINNVDTTHLMEISEPTLSALASWLQDGSNVEITSSPEGYTDEVFPLSVMSSDEQLAPVDFSPTDAGTIVEGSSSMSGEFSGTSELPLSLADRPTITFSIPTELSTSHLHFLSRKPVTFVEHAQTSTMEELSSTLLPLLPQSTTSGAMLVDNEDDPFSPTASRHLEESQSKLAIEDTFSTLIPFDASVSSDGSFESSPIPLETNPLALTTDSPSSTSFESLGTSHELSKDFTAFEPSLSTANPPITGEFQLITDVITIDQELDHSIQTTVLGTEGSEGNSFSSVDDDGSGCLGVSIATDQPFGTVNIPETSVTLSATHLFSPSLTNELSQHVDVALFLSTEMAATSETDVTNAVSAEVILDTATLPASLSRPSTHRPIIDFGTVSSLSITDDNRMMTGSGEQLWNNTLSEDSSVFLTASLEDTIPTDPPLSYTLVDMEAVSISDGNINEISTPSGAISSEEQFSMGKFSANVAATTTEGSSSTFDQFSGTSELPFDVGHTTTFFMPTELSTSHLNFLSGNSITSSGDASTLTEEELTSSVSPFWGAISTSGFELTDEEENDISHPTSLDLEDSRPTVPPEANLFSPISVDVTSPSSFSKQTVTPLQTNPLLAVTDSLTSPPLGSVGTSAKLSEDLASFSPSTAEPMLSEFQLLGTGLTVADEGVVGISTMAPIFENEGSSENWIVPLDEDGSGTTRGFLNATAQPSHNENWIVILEEGGSGAITPGFSNATDQPSQSTDSTSEIELTISDVHLSFSSPATSIAETYETGAVISSVESTSIRGLSDNVTEQQLVKDSFATTAMGFSGTMEPSSLPGSSIEMSISLTPPPTTGISSFDVTTLRPRVPPNDPPTFSREPFFDVVTVTLEPPSGYNMMASPTQTWYRTPTASSGSLVSSGHSTGSLALSPTSTTEIQTPSSTSLNSSPATAEILLTSSVPIVELWTSPSSTATYSPTPPSFSASTLMRTTTSPDAVPSPSTSSASPASISPNSSGTLAQTTVPPIMNLWNLLISRITTSDGILSLTKNLTSGSSLSDGNTPGLIKEELKGSSASSVSSTIGNFENAILLTRPFWLMTPPSPDSPPAFSSSHALWQETTPSPVAVSRTTSRNTEIPVRASTTTTSSTPSAADFFLTSPVWLQGISSTEGEDSIIVTYPHEPSKSIDWSALDAFPSVWKTSKTDTPSTPTLTPSSSVSSMTHAVIDDVVAQPNVTADIGHMKRNSSFHLEKFSEALNLLVASYPEIKEEEIQPSAICDAAGDSVLLKSLFCFNQSASAMKGKRFPNLVQLIRRLAPAIIANLTTALNQEVEHYVNVTQFDIDPSRATLSTTESTIPMSTERTTESTIPMSTERTTRSTILRQHSTQSFLLNLSATLLNNVPVSPLPTVLNVSLESLMENLAEQLKDTQLANFISAVNRLSQDVPEDFLESLIQNSSSNSGVFFSQNVRVEGVKGEMITTEANRSTSSTTTPTIVVHDVLQMNFWKTNRRNPVKKLQRIAGADVGILPTNGRYWWNTTKPISSLFRPFAKPAIGRS